MLEAQYWHKYFADVIWIYWLNARNRILNIYRRSIPVHFDFL
jgi:hypothetical protein